VVALVCNRGDLEFHKILSVCLTYTALLVEGFFDNQVFFVDFLNTYIIISSGGNYCT